MFIAVYQGVTWQELKDHMRRAGDVLRGPHWINMDNNHLPRRFFVSSVSFLQRNESKHFAEVLWDFERAWNYIRPWTFYKNHFTNPTNANFISRQVQRAVPSWSIPTLLRPEEPYAPWRTRSFVEGVGKLSGEKMDQ